MAWWERAEAGQRIVCRDAVSLDDMWGVAPLVVGNIYTIRSVRPPLSGDSTPSVGFLLNEIVNQSVATTCGLMERSYHFNHFSPARETSIEQFEAMLNPSPGRVREYMDELAEHVVEDLGAQGFTVWR